MKSRRLYTALIALSLMSSCDSGESDNEAVIGDSQATTQTQSATVTAVNFSGESGNYIFSVTVVSPDLGCNQYADWWEVVRPDGSLIHRRVLAHSHVNEQPFTRSGGPVAITADEEVIVRAHMNNTGYGTHAFTGSIERGFADSTIDASFASELVSTPPLPDSCAF